MPGVAEVAQEIFETKQTHEPNQVGIRNPMLQM